MDPHDGSYTVVHDPGMGQPRFTGAAADYLAAGQQYQWPGPTEPVDSHDCAYEIGTGPPSDDGMMNPNARTDAPGPGPDIPAND